MRVDFKGVFIGKSLPSVGKMSLMSFGGKEEVKGVKCKR
jgi:hypothetical protein